MKRKNILITGGSGYLGSHLCKQLLKKRYGVYIYDRKIPYHDYYTEYFSGDIRDDVKLNDAFHKVSFDYVIHLASRIEVNESENNPTEFWSVNVGGTVNLLQKMKRFGVEKIIFSSTAAVYWPSNVPLKETECIVNNSVYGNTKQACEMAIEDSGFKYVIFRYFNLAGADPDGDLGEIHNPETHLIPTIFNKINNFTINGRDYETSDGTCVRDYVHVSDVSDAHILAIDYLEQGNLSDHFNLGTGQGYSVLEIIKKIKKILDIDVTYKFGERRSGDPDCLVADITLATEKLGYSPKHDIDSIIKTAYDWHENNRH
jgi:UDP-glucose 4-epimerase